VYERDIVDGKLCEIPTDKKEVNYYILKRYYDGTWRWLGIDRFFDITSEYDYCNGLHKSAVKHKTLSFLYTHQVNCPY